MTAPSNSCNNVPARVAHGSDAELTSDLVQTDSERCDPPPPERAERRGVSPFARMSIFDSPSVTTHAGENFDYAYLPRALALFNRLIYDTSVQNDAVVLQTSGGTLVARTLKRIDRAVVRTDVRRLLVAHDYAPNLEEEAVKLVLEQAEAGAV